MATFQGPAIVIDHQRLIDGAAFILDGPQEVPAIWGKGEDVLWASGEPLMIVGPSGVGKTTIGQQLAFKRHGIGDPELVGLPVKTDSGRVLYIAADRPNQVRRSFRRMVGEADRKALEWLLIWHGPLEFGIADNPSALAEFVAGCEGVGTVVIDSLKDVAVGLSDDVVGSKVNLALQHVVTIGVEVAVLHHQRKSTGDNKRPTALADVYGSTWLTAGTGSVVLVWGNAGDPIVELRHLKQPAAEVGPVSVFHDHRRGVSSLHEPVDLLGLVNGSLNGGLTVRDATCALYGVSEPERNQVEKARRKLEDLSERGHVVKLEGEGPKSPTLYRPVSRKC